ncbi:hypothetical protein ACN28C_19375 [Plantactinospora sp. WMMC1484]|uniref:hypothetical protein n=1 Tax=Plantactinospora sp. WMMC1484 TaxID=3404122 RepID=UPI003BF4B587
MTRTVAILGAGGAVGARLAAQLTDFDLRLGSRRPKSGHRCVEATDPAALTDFCAGADVVVNCVGPIGRSRRAILTAAETAGAAYVDAAALGLDEELLSAADGDPTRPALFGAGATPGASELLMRWAAMRLAGRPVAMTVYAATLDQMTPGSAEDFLTSLSGEYGNSGAALVGGVVVAGALTPWTGRRLPFIPDDVTGIPFLSRDAAVTGRRVGVGELRCYHLFETGSPVLAALHRRLPGATKEPAAVGELRAVAGAVVAGRSAYQIFVVETTAADRTEVAVVRVPGTYGLTAAVLAAAVRGVPEVSPGRYRAAEVLAPDLLPGCVRAADGQLWTLDGPLAGYADVEAGAI